MSFIDLQAFLEKMPDRGIPACELSVLHRGEQVYRASVGFADPEKTRPASPDDLYWIFSASKVITCIAAMRLVEQGKMSLDDPVSRYLPSFSSLQVRRADGTLVPATKQMTLLHLFTMTGGMVYEIGADPIRNATDRSTVGIVSAMAQIPLAFEPGEHYRYSLCHDVLGAVVEVVSGMPFSKYLQENIFDPLEMKDIGFRPTEAQWARFSAAYQQNGTCEPPTLRDKLNCYALSDSFESGGAGLFSSVDDYAKLMTALSLGGTAKNGYRVLKPETVAMLGENRLSVTAQNDFVTTRLYGYGWGLCGRAHVNPTVSLSPTGVGEFGWDGAAGALALADPKNEVALFFCTHVRSCMYLYHKIHWRIIDMVYDTLGLTEK